MYATYIIDRAKGFVHENAQATAFSTTTLMRFLSDTVKELTSEVRSGFPLFGMTETTITQTSGTDGSDLPSRLDRIIDLRDSGDPGAQVYPADHVTVLAQGFALTDSQFYWVNNDQSTTYTLRYTRLPWDCHAGIAQSLADDTHLTLAVPGATTTYGDVWIGDAFDDYYNGVKLIVTDCTTAAKEYQEVTITDYDGGTGVVTVSAWPSGKPDGTVTYQIQPMIDPKEWHDLLAWGVALRMMVIGRKDPLVTSGSHPYRKARRRFLEHWRKRYGVQGKPVHYIALERSA